MFVFIRKWFYRRMVRKHYQHIVDYPHGGHHMAMMMRPSMYINMNKWWDRLAAVDPDIPQKPEWLDRIQ